MDSLYIDEYDIPMLFPEFDTWLPSTLTTHEHITHPTKKLRAPKKYVPDNLKDAKYWALRAKNNEAARRSRYAKKLNHINNTKQKKNRISVHTKLKIINDKLKQLLAENKMLLDTVQILKHTKNNLIAQIKS